MASGDAHVRGPVLAAPSPRPGAAPTIPRSRGSCAGSRDRAGGAADLERLARPRGLEPAAPRRGARGGRSSPAPELVAVLMKAQSQLEDLPEAKRVYWSRVLHDLLEGCPNGQLRDEAVAQAILHHLLTELYNARDTKFTNLATQQNKVTWMVLVGLAIMAALISQGYEEPAAGRRRRRRPEPAPAGAAAPRRAERLRALVVRALPLAGVRRAVGLGRPAAAAVAAALQRHRPGTAAARRTPT